MAACVPHVVTLATLSQPTLRTTQRATPFSAGRSSVRDAAACSITTN